MYKNVLIVTLFFFVSLSNLSAQSSLPNLQNFHMLPDAELQIDKADPQSYYQQLEGKKRYHYGHSDREHSASETLRNVGLIYGLTWIFYPTIQPKVFKVENGFSTYKKNFGRLVFDKDEPIWNQIVHPITGSQLYLLYRSLGYDRMSAFGLTTISSALFELTVEILTEPASVQDLYQTPVLGSILGYGLEHASMAMLNSESSVARIFGHLINPATLFPFYEGRTLIIPRINNEDKGAMLKVELNY